MPQILTHNWQLKLASLGLAATLWFFVLSAERSELTVPAVIEYTGLDRNLVLVGQRPETAEISLSALRSAMARVNPDTVRARVDLTDVGPGQTVVLLSPDRVIVPPGVTVSRITPAQLRIAVAPAATQSVAVVPQVRGAPAPGYAIKSVAVEPRQIEVKGERTALARHPALETVPVDISGSRRTVTQTVGLVVPEFAQLTRQRAVDVTVEIETEEAMEQAKRGSRK